LDFCQRDFFLGQPVQRVHLLVNRRVHGRDAPGGDLPGAVEGPPRCGVLALHCKHLVHQRDEAVVADDVSLILKVDTTC
jgi:hypothetical protein